MVSGQCNGTQATEGRRCIAHRISFRQKLGGRGHLHAVGRYAKGRQRFNVTGGTAAFDGAGGKIVFSHDNIRYRFHLVG
jgi:hypothetical protein